MVHVMGDPAQPNLFEFFLICFLYVFTWLISSRVKKYSTVKWRMIIFFNMIIGIVFFYDWLITAPIYNNVIPMILERAKLVDTEIVWVAILIGNTDNLTTTLLFIPTVLTVLTIMWLYSNYALYIDMFNKTFMNFEWKNRYLQKFVSTERDTFLPDIVLGPDSKTKEQVTIPGMDRTLNSTIIGPIGTGKTAALILPIIDQDLFYVAKYFNDFFSSKDASEKKRIKGFVNRISGFFYKIVKISKKDYLNGITIIEPSNDLCKAAYELAVARNIPPEAITYIDPTNPDTPSINSLQGDINTVAESFAMVIDGLSGSKGSNFFFEQSQRTHFKNHIYLLKLHDPENSDNVLFDTLLEMYDNPMLVRQLHLKLKKTIPEGYKDFKNRDERNHWRIVKQVDEWFDTNLIPLKDRQNNPVLVADGEYRGQQQFIDSQAEYVKGLRNILNDLGANKLIRRVLFGNSTFNYDKHLENGGILIVNTAKGELGDLAKVLGKFVLLSMHNATFRRKPMLSPFHSVVIDEFPDLVYKTFREYPAQSRKYKVILHTASQTTAQLAEEFGEMYLHALLASFRNKMVYGDLAPFDAKLFSQIFGGSEKFEESFSEQSISPLQENPVTRTGMSYRKNMDQKFSPNDLIYQDAFQCAVKIVKNNKPIPATQINANFVPKEQFVNADYRVSEEAKEKWKHENVPQEIQDTKTEYLVSDEEGNLIFNHFSFNEPLSTSSTGSEEINPKNYVFQTIEPTETVNYDSNYSGSRSLIDDDVIEEDDPQMKDMPDQRITGSNREQIQLDKDAQSLLDEVVKSTKTERNAGSDTVSGLYDVLDD